MLPRQTMAVTRGRLVAHILIVALSASVAHETTHGRASSSRDAVGSAGVAADALRGKAKSHRHSDVGGARAAPAAQILVPSMEGVDHGRPALHDGAGASPLLFFCDDTEGRITLIKATTSRGPNKSKLGDQHGFFAGRGGFSFTEVSGYDADVCFLGLNKFFWALVLAVFGIVIVIGCVPFLIAVSRRRPPGSKMFPQCSDDRSASTAFFPSQ